MRLTLSNFIKELPSQDKHKLNRIDEFQYVIVMGKETDDDREALNGIITALGVSATTYCIAHLSLISHLNRSFDMPLFPAVQLHKKAAERCMHYGRRIQ